jgi:hypothetical protein
MASSSLSSRGRFRLRTEAVGVERGVSNGWIGSVFMCCKSLFKGRRIRDGCQLLAAAFTSLYFSRIDEPALVSRVKDNDVPELEGLDRLTTDEGCEEGLSNFNFFAGAFPISNTGRFTVGGSEGPDSTLLMTGGFEQDSCFFVQDLSAVPGRTGCPGRR